MFRKLAGVFVAAIFCLGTTVSAQTPSTPSTPSTTSASATTQYGCHSPESKQFDFWLGDWEFTSQGIKGVNHVTKILGGCVVFENFGDGSLNTLNGYSLSTFDSATKTWKQTWVDNTASYLDFTGGMVDGKMIFTREAEAGGKKFLQRMVWFNIEKDKFSWSWDRSDDMGKTWKVLWPIEYRRLK